MTRHSVHPRVIGERGNGGECARKPEPARAEASSAPGEPGPRHAHHREHEPLGAGERQCGEPRRPRHEGSVGSGGHALRREEGPHQDGDEERRLVPRGRGVLEGQEQQNEGARHRGRNRPEPHGSAESKREKRGEPQEHEPEALEHDEVLAGHGVKQGEEKGPHGRRRPVLGADGSVVKEPALPHRLGIRPVDRRVAGAHREPEERAVHPEHDRGPDHHEADPPPHPRRSVHRTPGVQVRTCSRTRP